MSDIVELLKGSSGTSCRRSACMSGSQVCPHDDEEIIESLEAACVVGVSEIKRLRAALREVLSLSDDLDCPGPDGYYLEELQKIAREALGDE